MAESKRKKLIAEDLIKKDDDNPELDELLKELSDEEVKIIINISRRLKGRFNKVIAPCEPRSFRPPGDDRDDRRDE